MRQREELNEGVVTAGVLDSRVSGSIRLGRLKMTSQTDNYLLAPGQKLDMEDVVAMFNALIEDDGVALSKDVFAKMPAVTQAKLIRDNPEE